jgi:hypothetical protein
VARLHEMEYILAEVVEYKIQVPVVATAQANPTRPKRGITP